MSYRIEKKEIKRDPSLPREGFVRALRQWDAFMKGKRVMLTIENPDTQETNRKFIRVSAESAGWRRPSKNGEESTQE